jgi:hypothetical protein
MWNANTLIVYFCLLFDLVKHKDVWYTHFVTPVCLTCRQLQRKHSSSLDQRFSSGVPRDTTFPRALPSAPRDCGMRGTIVWGRIHIWKETMLTITEKGRCNRPENGKAIPVTGRGGLYGCEMLRIPHCLDNRLTDGGKVVSPKHPPHFTPQKHYYFYVSGTHFC